MKIKDIELANVSRYRGELMGAAMLFIILFHVPLARSNEFFGPVSYTHLTLPTILRV